MKKELKITITQTNNTNYRVELQDHYGSRVTVYEPSVKQAMQYALYWHEKTEQRYQENQTHAKAVMEMMAIDKKAGILTGNYDGLD